ncbi:MgtC/SapB family protein [Candidatus Woesearchaeota archaeon]|nr:MgtC/SapB family protein [Candidatus Woesearchaeota archaeon]
MTFLITGNESEFVVRLLLCLAAGVAIGIEREYRGKSAGISTHSFVIAGAMLFSYLSLVFDPLSPARIAAQVVTGVGFLGAGIILRGNDGKVKNLTTAASIWFSAALGMTIGFGWYLIALLSIAYAVLIPFIPQIKQRKKDLNNGEKSNEENGN